MAYRVFYIIIIPFWESFQVNFKAFLKKLIEISHKYE